MEKDFKQLSKDQFDQWSDTYDHGIWSLYFKAGYKQAIKYLPKRNNLEILDVGCGTGDLAISLAASSRVARVVGLDISEGMISVAMQKARAIKNNVAKLSFVIGESENLPASDNAFDVIFCLNSFHHHPSPSKTLKEMARVLRSAGIVVVLDPFTDGIIRKAWSSILKKLFNEPYVSYYSRKYLKKQFEEAGFSNVKTKTFLFFTLFTSGEKR